MPFLGVGETRLASSCVLRMKTTQLLVISLVVVWAGLACNGNCQNEARFEEGTMRRQTSNLLQNLSTKQRKHVKKELLNLLGLDHTPKSAVRLKAGEASAPKYMLSLYRNLQRYEGTEFFNDVLSTSSDGREMTSRLAAKQLGSADTIMSFINQGQKHHHTANKWLWECRFDLSQVSTSNILTAAILRIYKSETVHSSVERFRIEVLRLSAVNSAELPQSRGPFVVEQRVNVLSRRSEWIDINVTHLASDWMRNPSRNEELFIAVYNSKGDPVDPASVGIVGSEGSANKQIFLVAFFKTDPDETTTSTLKTMRRKRSTDHNNNNTNNRRQHKNHETTAVADDYQMWYRTYKHDKKCQIRSLYVSFKDLQWNDWIIAPEGYPAYYCAGDCVSPLYVHNATNHAIVQRMAYLLKPSSVPKPCCAPTKLAGLSVLYFDDNMNVILKKYRNMVVKGCGCH